MAPLAQGEAPGGLEYSVHSCPPSICRELRSVFPRADLDKLLIIPTCQHAVVDLVNTGDKVDDEKDRLLERFVDWSKPVCENLLGKGFWADYIDPCSGLPMIHTENNQVYPEVEGLSVLMGFKTANAGCCKILLHPKWGSAVYPATMFTEAPLEELLAVLEHVHGAIGLQQAESLSSADATM